MGREPGALRRRTAGNQIEADIKRPRRVVPRPHVAAAGAGDRLDDRRDGFAFHGVDCHIGLLPDVEMRAIVLIDLRDELDPGLVEDVRNLASRKHRVAGAELWNDDAGPGGVVHVVVFDGNEAIERRAQLHAVDVALRVVDLEPGLVSLFFEHRQRRAIGLASRFQILLELRGASLGFLERQHQFLLVDLTVEERALHVELRAAHIEARCQQRHLVLSVLHGGIGAHLRDFLLRLREFRQCRLEAIFHFALIEFDDDFAGLDRRARGGDAQDLHWTAHRRRHKGLSLEWLEFTGRVDHHRYVAFRNASGRDDGAFGLHALDRHGDACRYQKRRRKETCDRPDEARPILRCHEQASFHRRQWILQGDTIARLHAFANDELFLSAPRELHESLVPPTARPGHVGDRAAAFLKDRACRDQHHVGHTIDRHPNGGVHAWAQTRIDLIELHRHLEVALWRPVREVDPRQRADVANLPEQFLVGNGIRTDDDALAELHAAALSFLEPRRDSQRRQIRDFCDDLTRPRPVACLEIRRRAARTPVRHDVHHPVHRCDDLDAAELALCVVDVSARLVTLLRLAADLGFFDVAEGLQFAFRLGQPCLRIRQRELLLLRLHSREKFPRSHVELCAPDVVAGVREIGSGLLLLNAILRFCLADFFLRLLEFGPPVVQRTLDAHRIEPNDDITFLDARSVLRELEDLKIAAARGGDRQWNRPHSLHFAAHLNVIDELASHDDGCENVGGRLPAEDSPHARNGRHDADSGDRTEDREFVIAPHDAGPSFQAPGRT